MDLSIGDDDSEESSPQETLEQFREKWQNELNSTKSSQPKSAAATKSTQSAGSVFSSKVHSVY